MFPTITADQAGAQHWDVVIAGTSFAAMFFLHALPPGLRVLLVEQGQRMPLAQQIAQGGQPRAPLALRNYDSHPKEFIAHTLFGGNSNCWWACTPRFHPNDFRLHSTYGTGVDWPVGYDTLEPYYLQAEQMMEIAGGGSDAVLPRSAPFPFSPHEPPRSDRALMAKSALWWMQPTARANGGSRAQCCANGVCHLCPVDAKYTILNGIDAFLRDGVFLLEGTELRAFDRSAGRATSAIARHDGADIQLRGDLFALGCNGIFNAAILLRSGLQSPALGRYLHEQLGQHVYVDIGPGQGGYFGGTSISGHGYAQYDGPWRAQSGAVVMENYNAPPSIRAEPGRWTDRLHLKLIAEDLPQARNRVLLEDDAVVIDWHGHHAYARDGIARAMAALPDLLPFDIERVIPGIEPRSEAHIQGTHRMGNDPANSVTDDLLRCHEVPNLLALGAGSYPSCTASNPTLTLAALSLRAGEAVS